MRDQLARFFFVWKEVDIWKSSEYLWEPSVTSLLSSQIVGAVQRARAVNKITMLVWQIQMNKREFHDIWGELRVSKVFFIKWSSFCWVVISKENMWLSKYYLEPVWEKSTFTGLFATTPPVLLRKLALFPWAKQIQWNAKIIFFLSQLHWERNIR